MTQKAATTDIKVALQFKACSYNFNCPECGEYFEEEYRMDGKTVDCICGVKFTVGRLRQ